MEDERQLTPEQIEKLRKAFSQFADGENGGLTAESIEKALRAAGCNPTPEEVTDIQDDIEDEADFNTFAYIYYRHSRCVNVEEELIESFEIFDKDGTGYLTVDKIRNILSNVRTPFTEEQIDDLLDKVTIQDNKVKYTELVKAMITA